MDSSLLPFLFLIWSFAGLACAYLAKKMGRNPYIWFTVGFALSALGICLLFLVDSFQKKKRAKKAPPSSKRPTPEQTEMWTKYWYYLDAHREQQGPIELPDLAAALKKRALADRSLIWGEGMEEWKPLSELPILKQELETVH